MQEKSLSKKTMSQNYSLFDGKYCNKCLTFLSLESFHKDKKSPNGRTSICKSCVSAYHKWLKQNPAGERKKLRKERELNSVRKCKVCEIEKPVEDFPKHSNGKHIQYRCKRCAVEYSKKRYWKEKAEGDKPKIRNRKTTLKRYYGITLEQYEEMFIAQKGVCLTCGLPEQRAGREYLSVDHCHKTGKIRGLLCSLCNTALGCAKDNIEVLQNMVNYLRSHSDFTEYK